MKQKSQEKSKDYGFRVQVSPLDCTGCGSCADVCPVRKSFNYEFGGRGSEGQAENWEYAMTISTRGTTSQDTLLGSQLIGPLLEFNGACQDAAKPLISDS